MTKNTVQCFFKKKHCKQQKFLLMTHTHWYLLLIPVISLFIDLCSSIRIYFTYSLACAQVTFPPPRSHTVLGDDCPMRSHAVADLYSARTSALSSVMPAPFPHVCVEMLNGFVAKMSVDLQHVEYCGMNS